MADLALADLATAADVAVAASGVVVAAERAGPIEEDSRLLLFSLSKPLAAAAALTLVDAGELEPETRVAAVLPEFGAAGKADVTLDDVLTHRGGFPDAAPGEQPRLRLGHFRDWEGAVRTISSLPLVPALHGIASYHALSFSIVGAIVERVAGVDFSAYCREKLFEPLAMSRTTWGLPRELEGSAVGLVGSEAGEWTDPALRSGLIPAGNAWSTAADVLRFFLMLRGGGALGATRVLEEATVELMTRPHADAAGQAGARHFGYGLFVGSEPESLSGRGEAASERCYGHAGFTGTQAWFEPETDLALVALTNACVDQAASDRRFSILSDEVRLRYGSRESVA